MSSQKTLTALPWIIEWITLMKRPVHRPSAPHYFPQALCQAGLHCWIGLE